MIFLIIDRSELLLQDNLWITDHIWSPQNHLMIRYDSYQCFVDSFWKPLAAVTDGSKVYRSLAESREEATRKEEEVQVTHRKVKSQEDPMAIRWLRSGPGMAPE